MSRLLLPLLLGCSVLVTAQEADSGFALATTLSSTAAFSRLMGLAPRHGDGYTGGVRLMAYPTWKISRNWSLPGIIQVRSRPYFLEDFITQGYGLRADVLRGALAYSRVSDRGSLVVRAGVLGSAFGSFLLRYDDNRNPLVDMPLGYGYYGGIGPSGLTGVKVDANRGRFDGRAQLTSSSPVNRRGIGDHDGYAVWTGGAGFTIVQGLRIGGSAFRGPYLDRQYAFFFPGEANPKDLPGIGYGLDVSWGRGPWSANGELQRLKMTYRAIPNFTTHSGHAELKRVLTPRWYVAGRAGYQRASVVPGIDVDEAALGYRLTAHQLIKAGYQFQHGPRAVPGAASALVIQFVATLPQFSLSRP